MQEHYFLENFFLIVAEPFYHVAVTDDSAAVLFSHYMDNGYFAFCKPVGFMTMVCGSFTRTPSLGSLQVTTRGRVPTLGRL